MSKVLKLRYDTTDLSFMAGSAGFQLTRRGWFPGVSMAGEAITENMNLVLKRDSADNVAASMQALASMQWHAEQYRNDSTQEEGTWLWSQAENETGGRRAAVLSIDWSPNSDIYSGQVVANNLLTIGADVTRMPWWEAYNIHTGSSVTSAAGITAVDNFDNGTAIAGDVPARLTSFVLNHYPAAGGQLDRAWVGLRSANKHGTVANFVNIWELEDGRNTAISADAVDATASGGDRVDATPAVDATWENALTIVGADVTLNYADNMGRFMWLLRADTSGETFYVQLRFGYEGVEDENFVRSEIVEWNTASVWDIKNMDVRSIPLVPPRALGGTTSAIATYKIQVWVYRATGSGAIKLDCLLPVPIDEGFFTMSGLSGDTVAAGMTYKESPIGEKLLYLKGLVNQPVWEAQGFRYPLGTGNVYVVYARSASSVITDRVTLGVGQCYECYRLMRGAS